MAVVCTLSQMKGPGKFKRNNDWIRYKNPEILSGTITYSGRTFQLESNKLSVEKSPEGRLYVYHSYDYIKDGEINGGRWYDLKMAADTFGVLPENRFQIHLTNYELEDENAELIFFDVDISLVFSEKTASALRSL
jgi:hypothetical protein